MTEIEILSQRKFIFILEKHETNNILLESNRTEINKCWDKAYKKKSGKLFNGKMCFFSRIESEKGIDKIFVVQGQYKHFLCQRMGLPLGLIPVGVSGITFIVSDNSQYILMGKRASWVTQYPNRYELIPSGGINSFSTNSRNEIEPIESLCAEFYEELNLETSTIEAVNPIAVIKDSTENVIDACYLIVINHKLDSILKKINISDEYQDIIPVKIDTQISLNSIQEKYDCIPCSIQLLRLLKDNILSCSRF
jgi:hypothetical protein